MIGERRIRLMTCVAGLFVGCAALVGCGGPDRLEVLRSDPMAGFTPSSGTLQDETSAEGNTGLGKPTPASLQRTFSVPEDDVPAAVEECAAAAREAGWEFVDEGNPGYSGVREIDGLTAQISIKSIEADGLVWVELSTRSD